MGATWRHIFLILLVLFPPGGTMVRAAAAASTGPDAPPRSDVFPVALCYRQRLLGSLALTRRSAALAASAEIHSSPAARPLPAHIAPAVPGGTDLLYLFMSLQR